MKKSIRTAIADLMKNLFNHTCKRTFISVGKQSPCMLSFVDMTYIRYGVRGRNLGAWLDSRMDMEQHVNSVCKSCFGQIRQIGHIRQYLTTDATKSLVNSLVTSRLDYCNALLSIVPKTILNKLQNVQNTAARVVTRTSRYCHITPILKELHWLPVQYRVQYKSLTHTYKALQ